MYGRIWAVASWCLLKNQTLAWAGLVAFFGFNPGICKKAIKEFWT